MRPPRLDAVFIGLLLALLPACGSTSQPGGSPDHGSTGSDAGTRDSVGPSGDAPGDATLGQDQPSSVDAPAGTDGGDASTGPDIAPPPTESYSLTWGPVTNVQPGTERTQCVVKRLGNPNALHVGTIHNQLSLGSHHVIVYRTNDTQEQPDPFDCQPFTDTLDPSKGNPLMITQKMDEVLTLPHGVAFTLDPNQMIRIEMHYINAGTRPLDISVTTTFSAIPDGEFQNEAAFLFIGNPDINIPAHSDFTLGPTFFAPPSNLAGVNYFALTGHTHHLGTNVTIETALDAMGAGTSVYDVPNWSWNEPATVYMDPPFQIPSGGGFRFTCSYTNPTDNAVGFGESANDEMCFFWAYYYPSQGSFVCAHTDQVPGGFDICCPGNPICSQVF